METLKRSLTVVLAVAAVLAAVFLAGRYGWKLSGFRACQGAGIDCVEVDEKAVHITGFYPGSFPEGFCGYYAQEQDGSGRTNCIITAKFQLAQTGAPGISPVQAAFHCRRQLIRPPECRDKQRDKNRNERFCPVQQIAGIKICAAGALCAHNFIGFLHQCGNKPQSK